MSNTVEIKQTNYAARQKLVNELVIPLIMLAGVPLSWFAASGERAYEVAFLFVLVYQATLAAIWIGFRRINALTQCLMVVLLVAQGVFAARRTTEGLLNILLQEAGWVLAPTLALVLCCRLWNLWYTIDPSYGHREESEGHEMLAEEDRVQFGILHLMLFTVFVAILGVSAPRILMLWELLFEEVRTFIIFIVVGSLQAIAAIWAVLGVGSVWWRIALTIPAVVFLFWLLDGMGLGNSDYVLPLYCEHHVLLLAYLALCRWCGHRLVAWPNVVGINGLYQLTDRWHQRPF